MSYANKVEQQREVNRRIEERRKFQKSRASASGAAGAAQQKADSAIKQIPTVIVNEGYLQFRFCSWCQNPLRWHYPAHTNLTCPGRRVDQE